MVAGHVIEVLTAVPGCRGILPHDLCSFIVGRSALVPRQIAQVDGDVPIEGRSAFVSATFRLADGFSQAFALGDAQVGPHVGAADGPYAELSLLRYAGSGREAALR